MKKDQLARELRVWSNPRLCKNNLKYAVPQTKCQFSPLANDKHFHLTRHLSSVSEKLAIQEIWKSEQLIRKKWCYRWEYRVGQSLESLKKGSIWNPKLVVPRAEAGHWKAGLIIWEPASVSVNQWTWLIASTAIGVVAIKLLFRKINLDVQYSKTLTKTKEGTLFQTSDCLRTSGLS